MTGVLTTGLLTTGLLTTGHRRCDDRQGRDRPSFGPKACPASSTAPHGPATHRNHGYNPPPVAATINQIVKQMRLTVAYVAHAVRRPLWKSPPPLRRAGAERARWCAAIGR